jgi:drug/metabolite transporter (DMT)-like permease
MGSAKEWLKQYRKILNLLPEGVNLIKKHYIKLFFAPVLWGGALVAGRIVAVNLPPFTTTLIRYIVVSLFLLPILYWKNGNFPVPTKKTILQLIIVSISGVLLFNYFLFSGLRTVTAIRSAIFIATTPIVIALLSAIFFHEKFSLPIITGIFIAFLGAIITLSNGNLPALFKEQVSIGDLYLVGCIFAWAAYSISVKYAIKEISTLTVLTYSSVIGVILLIPLVIQEGAVTTLGTQPFSTWISILYLSIGAAGFAHLWYYDGIQAIGISRSAIFLNLEPVAAITLGIVILGEKLTYSLSAGAVLVMCGLVLINYKKRK